VNILRSEDAKQTLQGNFQAGFGQSLFVHKEKQKIKSCQQKRYHLCSKLENCTYSRLRRLMWGLDPISNKRKVI
jgi:hypothetical protein